MMYNPPEPWKFNAVVWEIVRQIPAGRVGTYGQIASMIPPPTGVDPEQYRRLGARWVGSAMRALPDGDPTPWHRVINSRGEISLPTGSLGAEEQRALLECEGVLFDEEGRVDFGVVGWEGPDETWLRERGLHPPYPPRPPGKAAGSTRQPKLF